MPPPCRSQLLEAEAPFTGSSCEWFQGDGTRKKAFLPDAVLRTLPEPRAAAAGMPWQLLWVHPRVSDRPTARSKHFFLRCRSIA